MTPILKHWSAWVPLGMSLAVIATWIIAVAAYGAPMPEPDEGTAAHLFQIWLGLEALLLAFFAIWWLPQKPKEALFVLAIQILAVLAGCFPVFYFHL